MNWICSTWRKPRWSRRWSMKIISFEFCHAYAVYTLLSTRDVPISIASIAPTPSESYKNWSVWLNTTYGSVLLRRCRSMPYSMTKTAWTSLSMPSSILSVIPSIRSRTLQLTRSTYVASAKAFVAVIVRTNSIRRCRFASKSPRRYRRICSCRSTFSFGIRTSVSSRTTPDTSIPTIKAARNYFHVVINRIHTKAPTRSPSSMTASHWSNIPILFSSGIPNRQNNLTDSSTKTQTRSASKVKSIVSSHKVFTPIPQTVFIESSRLKLFDRSRDYQTHTHTYCVDRRRSFDQSRKKRALQLTTGTFSN